MLISYPVLGVPQINQSPYGGTYPVTVFTDSRHKGLSVGWHGGLHLVVGHSTRGTNAVRAIADGTVVAYRVPTRWVEKDGKRVLLNSQDPALKDHILNYTGSWTDDGFVILKHEKECGEGRPVVFYSLYMHLSELNKGAKGSPGYLEQNPKDPKDPKLPWVIRRKENLGNPGLIEDQTNQIHLEIFTSDEALKKFFQPGKGSMDPWGELYFVIPAGQSVFREKPRKGAKVQPSGATPAEMRIALRYRDGDIHFRSQDEHGLELEAWPITGGEYAQEDCTGDEYELYGEAGKIDRGKLSRTYELLRFGRFMEWPELADDKKPAPAHCWHFLPMLNGWVDFADASVRKASDADFLEWQWQQVPLGQAGFDPASGECLVSQLFSSMDENGEGHLTEVEFGDWSKREENKALLRKLVVQFQSEWDGREPDQRWGWVKEMWANPIKHETAALQNKKAWVEAQKAQAMRSLPALEQRVLKAKGWRSQIAVKKADAEAALAAAQTSQDEARKAREDFISDVGGQSTQLAPLTPPKKHQDAVLAKRKGLTKAVDAAIDARKQAEARVKETVPMLAKAEAWVTREETKYRAAKDGIALADPLMADLQKSIEATAKQTVAPNAASQAEMDFTEYKAYMKALQFWEQVPGLPDSKVWHFHPLAFIEFFRKCHWLSAKELEAVYPHGGESEKAKAARGAREDHRIHLNRVMWKYGITTPTRMAYLLGQVQQESRGLSAFVEEISKSECEKQYENRQDLGNTVTGDGWNFRGRGMKQLTGRFNYMRYWVFRGWLGSEWLGKRWFFTKAEMGKPAAEKEKIRKAFSSPPPVDNFEDASKPFNAIDTGGYYWLNGAGDSKGRPISKRLRERVIDRNTANAVSKDVNPYEKGEPTIDREFYTYKAWDVLGDEIEPRFSENAHQKARAPYAKLKKKKT